MEIIDRKENPLLNRVEIEFRWNHDGKPTPSRVELLNGVATMEPGSNRDLIVVKNVNTRFGAGTTTGLGLVYSDEKSLKVEPDYMLARYAGIRSSSASPAEKEAPAEEAPAEEAPAEEAPAEEAPAEEEAPEEEKGGEA
jgi:ribosomal protein S24E